MERTRQRIAAGRAHTDASLGAERATSDADRQLQTKNARQELDDHIEIDRLIADSRLVKLRKIADGALAKERYETPAPNAAVQKERTLADQSKNVERKLDDAILRKERARSDEAVESERRKQNIVNAELDTRRVTTDEQLSIERRNADIGATDLAESMDALAQSAIEQARRDDLLGIVMHDLRSPLSIISMNASFIAEVSQDAQTKERVRCIQRGAARMERLLMDLLDVARIQSGTLRIAKERHDICAMLREVSSSYSPLFEERDIAFTVAVPATAIMLAFDHDRIIQVLSNLLGNALKFTAKKGSVALSVEQLPDQVCFALKDDGPGISPDAIPHVFERFWQIDNGTRRGLGLGLHICEQIVQAHRGRIWLESELGKGAAFYFTLPGAP